MTAPSSTVRTERPWWRSAINAEGRKAPAPSAWGTSSRWPRVRRIRQTGGVQVVIQPKQEDQL